MSDSLTLNRTRVTMIINTRVHIHDVRCLIRFARAIVIILLERSVHLSKWGIHRASRAKAASKQRQFGRWLKNAKIEHTTIFPIWSMPYLQNGEVTRFTWHWIVVACEKYSQILKSVAAILPKGCPVILLADRGFDDNEQFCAVRDLGWGFRIRVKKSLRVYRVSKPCQSVGRLMPAKGNAMFLHKVWITELRFGLVYLALAHVKMHNGSEEWAILSDDPNDLHTFDEYGLRFDLEENFFDDKSAGFLSKSGEIRYAGAHTRLGLILATATLYLIDTSTAIVSLGLRHLVNPH